MYWLKAAFSIYILQMEQVFKVFLSPSLSVFNSFSKRKIALVLCCVAALNFHYAAAAAAD